MLMPSSCDRQYALFALLLMSAAHAKPLRPSLLTNGLKGPALEAYGLSESALFGFCHWVPPIKADLRANAQKPLITEALLKSPEVTKLRPPPSTSPISLLITNDQNGLTQIAEKLFCAQLKLVVKLSSTTTSQAPPWLDRRRSEPASNPPYYSHRPDRPPSS